MSDTLRERLELIAAPARRVACTYEVPAACGKPRYGDIHPAKCEPCEAILGAVKTALADLEGR